MLLPLMSGALLAAPAHALLITYTGMSGLSAEAEFTMVNATTVTIRLKNTSTGVPGGFTAAGQLLTGVSWDAGAVGIFAGDPEITGGTIVTGPTSFSINFSVTNVGSNANVGGEWGYGNNDGTGLMNNFISGNASLDTPFGGPNLGGPVGLDGPQAGLYSSSAPLPLGGLGAIQDEVIATITLSVAISSLDDLLANGSLVEFGSSAAFVPNDVPAPGALALLGTAGLLGLGRRRRR